MLRETLFCEVELVRYEDGEQAAPSRRLDFSIRPLRCLSGVLLAGTVALSALAAYALCRPEEPRWPDVIACRFDPDGYDVWEPHTGCGGFLLDGGGDIVTPLKRDGDSTRLVRGLP